MKSLLVFRRQLMTLIVAWTEEWGMTLNASKTKVMMFGAGKGDTIDLKMDQ